ncbi:hypothetical protein [Sporosarcina sp. NPDC096371]|uniref:hypothetical protein n=1 Tax=Sporosarcina sp. NPDC096371 TaxID=3364530 RepID=UPI0037FE3EE0
MLREANINTAIKYIESETIDLQQLIDFHYRCYKKGYTKAAITCHPIQEQLQLLGIPAYRLFPTQNSVDSVVMEIRRVYEMLHFKRAQIAVQIIEYDAAFIGFQNIAFTTEKLHEIELEFLKNLRIYTKKFKDLFLQLVQAVI